MSIAAKVYAWLAKTGLVNKSRHPHRTDDLPVGPEKVRFQGLLSRPDEPGFVLQAEKDVPSRRVAGTIAAGEAYFAKYGFTFALKESPLAGAPAAVRDLAAREPAIGIDGSRPDASIILPIYGQLHFALNCLASLAELTSRYSAEIIILDDASPDAMMTRSLEQIPWLRYIRREQNAGFLDACNDAAGQARGRFLIFLNSDTRVGDAWLDELIGSFDIFPKAGLVGSKLYNDDGSLQEAGGIFWREGSAWNYGRDDDGDHPQYCFARQVDYCSGAAIAVAREAWQAAKGFDPIYRPAYCEDADIAFRLRELGFEVWLQPLSYVVHYEGRTHGRDLNTGVKAYQVKNMRTFADRWKKVLASHRSDGVEPQREADRFARRRILLIDAETPTPDRACGSVIAMTLIRALMDFGYRITFVPQENYCFEGRYTCDLQRQGIECIGEPFFKNLDGIAELRDDFDYILAFRYYTIGPHLEKARHLFPRARIVFSNVDLHYLREERQAKLVGNPEAAGAALETKAAELAVFRGVDCSIVHTEVEAQIVRSETGCENIIVLPYIAEPLRNEIGFDQRSDIMFLGGFAHLPNVDAMSYFVRSIWPSLVAKLPPQARLLIVGSAPPQEILDLAGDRIVVTGFVKDLEPWFNAARVFVAPLRFGAGIKGKVVESLRHGTPAVVTPIAAEGIGLVSGKSALIADLDADFAETVVTLYADANLWAGVREAGYELVAEQFSEQRGRALFAKALEMADATWARREGVALRQPAGASGPP